MPAYRARMVAHGQNLHFQKEVVSVGNQGAYVAAQVDVVVGSQVEVVVGVVAGSVQLQQLHDQSSFSS